KRFAIYYPGLFNPAVHGTRGFVGQLDRGNFLVKWNGRRRYFDAGNYRGMLLLHIDNNIAFGARCGIAHCRGEIKKCIPGKIVAEGISRLLLVYKAYSYAGEGAGDDFFNSVVLKLYR